MQQQREEGKDLAAGRADTAPPKKVSAASRARRRLLRPHTPHSVLPLLEGGGGFGGEGGGGGGPRGAAVPVLGPCLCGAGGGGVAAPKSCAPLPLLSTNKRIGKEAEEE